METGPQLWVWQDAGYQVVRIVHIVLLETANASIEACKGPVARGDAGNSEELFIMVQREDIKGHFGHFLLLLPV